MGRALFGLGLIVLGVILLGDRLDYWDAGAIISVWWPLIIVAIGVAQLTVRPRPWLGAGIVVAIGVLLLAARLDALPVGTWDVLWPALLIVIGSWIVLAHLRGRRIITDGGETVNIFAVLGDARSASNSSSFAGGSVSALMGGATLDLRRATPRAEGADISATSIFGDADIIVPAGWDIHVSGLPIFGDVEDKTERDGLAPPGTPRLNVNGFALFGDVEVKHG